MKRKLLYYTDFVFPIKKEEKKKGIIKTGEYVLKHVEAQKRVRAAKVKDYLENNTRHKNRNQHHQNHQQTQYRNHKRR